MKQREGTVHSYIPNMILEMYYNLVNWKYTHENWCESCYVRTCLTFCSIKWWYSCFASSAVLGSDGEIPCTCACACIEVAICKKSQRRETWKWTSLATYTNSLLKHPYGTLSPIKEKSLRAKCDTLSINSLFKFQRWNLLNKA